METSQLSLKSAANRRPRFQFRLRSLLFVATLLCVPLAVLSLKMQQDRQRSQAFVGLRSMGFQWTISSRPAEFLCIRPELSDSDLSQVASHLDILTRRHDLGLSRGLVIHSIDLSNSRVTPSGVAELQKRFPDAAITQPSLPALP